MGWDVTDKRIGKRQQIKSVPMIWVPEPAPPGWGFRAETEPDGQIVELSVSGAGIVARTRPDATIDSIVSIACLGVTGRLIVKRIEADIYPGESYYGMAFADSNSELTHALYNTIMVKENHAINVYLPRG